MADEDARNDGPSLELPSLGFGRRRRKKDRRSTTESTIESTAGDTAVQPVAPPAPPAPPAPAVAPPAPKEPETRVDLLAGTTRAAEPAVPEPAPSPAPEPEPTATPTAPARKARRSLPAIGGLTAAVLTGLVVGLATVGLTWASLRLCEVARGTSSCGGPGFLLLLAIVIAMVVLGALLLRALRQPDPGSTSFLAVGLLAVVTLLFLVDVVFDWWMVIAIPLFSVLTFVLAHWVTTTFVEPAER